MDTFLKSCTSCGLCTSACLFLERYGTPYSIISSRSEYVFLCTNCRACDMLCPVELSPSEALHKLKQEFIKTGSLSNKISSLIQSSYSFAMRGHRFPFKYYSQTETAFWPGCSLAGTRPDIVKRIPILLKDRFGNVGLVFDCCFDPLFHHGVINAVKAASERIKKRLRNHGIKRLILGCTNCKKIFTLFMSDVETFHVLEVIEDKKIYSKSNLKELYLHHPCPSFRFYDLRERARRVLSGIGEVKKQLTSPSCCGLGGGSYALSDKLSNEFSEKVIKDAEGNPIVTYCMGCKNKFLKNGKETYHILELILGLKPFNKPVSSGKKWFNRFMLSIKQKIKSKRFLLGLSIIITIFAATYLRRSGYISAESLFDFIKQYKILAPALFIAFYSVGPSLFIPSLPLTLGAGFLWGPFLGVVFSITGATIGASIPFLVSRYVLREAIKEKFGYERWRWLEEKVNRHGWKAVAFTRIVPLFPYPVLNYLFGVTPIPFLHYLWSTFVFMLPACIAYVAFGNSMEELIFKGNIKGIILGIVIATVAMLLPFALKPMFKKIFPG